MSIANIERAAGELHRLNKAMRSPVLSGPPEPSHLLQIHDGFLRPHEAEIVDAELFRMYPRNLSISTGRICEVLRIPGGAPFNAISLGFSSKQVTDKFIVLVLPGERGEYITITDDIFLSLSTPWIGRPEYNTYAYGAENWVFGTTQMALSVVAVPVGIPAAALEIGVTVALSLMTG